MKSTRKTFILCAVVVAFCIVMALAEGLFKVDYFSKSVIKTGLFLVLPVLYALFDKDLKIKPLFTIDKKGIRFASVLCIAVYILILGGYLLLKNVFDFSAITDALASNIGVSRDNFIFVSLYISFVNSFLEEFFFRGFAFLTLKRLSGKHFAYLFSAGCFAIYHIAMMTGWFSIGVFLLIMAGLFAGGLIFNYLNEKSGTIYPSWLVHMFANFAINTVGFMLFGILPAF